MSRVAERLGRGWRFPVAPRGGDLQYEEGAEKVRQALWIVLDTEPGERVMRPTFGCGLRRFLMKPNTAATRALIQQAVAEAIGRHEPRVSVQEVRAEPGDDAAMVLVHVGYTHVRDGKPGNLVYPFYLE
ncbi:MAG TPA: GPW/gp25 family protein [Longimicrobium sp.]